MIGLLQEKSNTYALILQDRFSNSQPVKKVGEYLSTKSGNKKGVWQQRQNPFIIFLNLNTILTWVKKSKETQEAETQEAKSPLQ